MGYEFGYGRPDLGEYEFEDEETREYLEGYLELLWVRKYASLVGNDGDKDEDENESGRVEDGQQVGGDGDGSRVRTKTDSTNVAASAAGQEEETSMNDEHADPDTPAAPAPSNTTTQQATGPVANNDASAVESQAQNHGSGFLFVCAIDI